MVEGYIPVLFQTSYVCMCHSLWNHQFPNFDPLSRWVESKAIAKLRFTSPVSCLRHTNLESMLSGPEYTYLHNNVLNIFFQKKKAKHNNNSKNNLTMLLTFEATLVDPYYQSTKPELQIFGFWWTTHLHLPQSHIEVVFKSNKEGQHIYPCTIIKFVILQKNSQKPNNHFN